MVGDERLETHHPRDKPPINGNPATASRRASTTAPLSARSVGHGSDRACPRRRSMNQLERPQSVVTRVIQGSRAGSFEHVGRALSMPSRRPVKMRARSCWSRSVAWSRWRRRIGMNWGPVSKKPHRSQMVSKLQSSAAGRVQCPLPRRRRWHPVSAATGRAWLARRGPCRSPRPWSAMVSMASGGFESRPMRSTRCCRNDNSGLAFAGVGSSKHSHQQALLAVDGDDLDRRIGERPTSAIGSDLEGLDRSS